MEQLKKYLPILFLAFLSLGGIFFYQFSKFSDGKLHVVFCDVGQGDAVFIRTPKGNDILVDGGPNDKVLTCLNSHMPFWNRDLELVILTHPHVDHIIGLISVLKKYKVLSFATSPSSSSSDTYKELIRILKEKGITEKILSKGDKFTSNDGIILTTQWPRSSKALAVLGSETEYFDQNDSSVVELLSFGKLKVLLPGDVSSSIENELASSISSIDILKVSHHGSKTGTSKEFLEAIRPKLAVISVGKNNSYNLPASSTLELLKSFGIKTLRTDQNGEVEVVSDGEFWGVQEEGQRKQ